MVLKYLKESLRLNERLSGDGIEFIAENNGSKLYKITALSGFDVVGEHFDGDIAEKFGFTQANWNQYMVGDHAQTAYCWTNSDDILLGIFLTSHNSHDIELVDGPDIPFRFSYESLDGESSYQESVRNTHYTSWAPLYTVPEFLTNAYTIGTGENCGQVIVNNALRYVGPEFGDLSSLHGTLKISDDCTSIRELTFNKYVLDTLDDLVIPQSVDVISENAFGSYLTENERTRPLRIWFDGDKESVFSWLDFDELSDKIEFCTEYGLSDEEREQRRAEAEAREQERIRQENQEAAQVVIDAINDLGDATYSLYFKGCLDNIKDAYDELTDAQKALVTNYNDFETKKAEFETLKQNTNAARAEVRANSNKLVEGPLVFVIKNGVACLTFVKPNAQQDELHIPETINGYKVTRIERGVFEDNDNFNHIIIPNNIEYIGPYAFHNCGANIEINDYEQGMNHNIQISAGNDSLSWNY